MDVPIYVECPTVFSCIIDDAWGLLDWRSIGFALLVWFVNVSLAYKRGSSREMTRLWLALKRSLVPTLVVWGFAFLFIALVYSPWQRYGALKEYAKTLRETQPKIVYRDTLETLEKLKSAQGEVDRLKKDDRHQRLSLAPYLHLSFFHSDRTGAGWTLQSTGPGHAVVKWFAVWIDDIGQSTWQDVAKALGIPVTDYDYLYPAERIVPNVHYRLFWVKPGDYVGNWNQKKFRMEICFCSLYEDCWLTTNLLAEKTKEHACKTPPRITMRRY